MTVSDYPDEQVEKKLREKIEAGSQDPDDYRNLTDLLFPSGRYDEVITLLQRALTLPLTVFKKAQLSMELGWIYYNIGQEAHAMPLAREALSFLSTEPKTTEVLYCLGASQALLSFSDSFADPNGGAEAAALAIEWLEKAIADGIYFRDKPYAYIDAARLHSTLGNMEKAIAHCEKCLGQEINQIQRVSCLIVYAQSLQGKERFVEAEEAIAEAFHYGKNYKSGLFQTLYMELGSIQRFTNRLAESKKSFEQALAALKSDPYFHSDTEILGEIRFNLATVCYELGEYQNAVSAYNEVLRCKAKDDISHWTALYWLGRSYEGKGDYDRARDCYEGVVEASYATEDDKTLARNGLMWVDAKLKYEAGKYDEAAAAFEEVVSRYPEADMDYWPAILWLGNCYEGLGAYAKSRACYEQALGSPHTSDANKAIAEKGFARSLAKLAYESGDYQQAAERFETVLDDYPESDPERWDYMMWLGSSYQALGDYAKEQACYQKILSSRHSSDAEKVLARKKLTSSLGKAYYATKSYAEAIAAFEEVIASCSEDEAHRSHISVWLGCSYGAIGMHESARDCLQKVLASPVASEADKTSARNALLRL